MKILTEKNPDTDYYFIIGADMVDYLPKWYRIDELVDLVQFVGVQRPRYKAGTSYPVIWVDMPLMDISSSMVRDSLPKDAHLTFSYLSCTRLYRERRALLMAYQDYINCSREELLEKMAELLP